MADISALGELKPVEQLDLDNYADQRAGSFRLAPKGIYTLQAPETFTFGRTNAGALSAQIDPTIVGPTNEGFKIRFVKVSAKVFKRGGKSVSQLGDYLRATGFRGILADEQAQADAVESTANSVYQAELDWSAYNKDSKYRLEGMENFPSDGNGGYLPWCEDPTAKDEEGNPVRLRANLIVTRYIPQTA